MIHFTSYFENIENIPGEIKLFSIARFSPRTFHGESFSELAPSKELLRQYKLDLIDKSDYIKVYRNYLDRNKERLLNQITLKIGDNQSCFLCYELPYKFCHRQLLSEWINMNSDLTFMEFRGEYVRTQKKIERYNRRCSVLSN